MPLQPDIVNHLQYSGIGKSEAYYEWQYGSDIICTDHGHMKVTTEHGQIELEGLIDNYDERIELHMTGVLKTFQHQR